MAIDEGDGGRLAVGYSSVRLRRRCAPAMRSLCSPISSKTASAVTENDGNAGNGIPDDVAETAQAGKVDSDRVPVGMRRAASSGVPMVMRRWADCGIEPE